MSESLYTLTDKLLALAAYIESADGSEELKELLEDSEEALQLSIDEKLEGIMTIRQNKLARIGAIQDEIKRLNGIIEGEQKTVTRLEKYAEEELVRLGHSYKDKKKAVRAVGKFNLKFKKLPPKLEIVDAKKIPPQYMNIPTPKPPEPKPDAKELLDLLKQKAEFLHGKKWAKEIDGLELEEFGIKMVNNNQKFEIE